MRSHAVMTDAELNSGFSWRGELRRQVPLARYTTWRIGGPAERFYRPADLSDLQTFLATLPAEEPLLWLGLGSNVLIRDGGIRGTVVYTRGRLKQMRLETDGGVYVEAGVPCAHVARFCARHGLVGAEFLAGIPGTLGGALAMNAGAFGGETWALVDTVTTLDRQGRCRQRSAATFQVGYRSVTGLDGGWFAAARLRLEAGDTEAGQARIRELLARRNRTQPLQQPSCGSVFRNPDGDYAARLIEACGLKGQRLGAAQVSAKHANFIINTGAASSAEVEGLIRHVQQAVAKRFGVRLQTEVRILGEPAGGAQ